MSETLKAAISASALGDSTTALALLTQASAEQPGSALPYLLMGAEHAKLGAVDKAEAGFANALLLEPGLVVARYQLGLLQLSSARSAMALLTWQPLLQLGESSPLPHFVLGFEALVHDQFVQARQHFEAGLMRNSDNPAMSEDIQMVLNKMDAIAPDPDRASGGPAVEKTEKDFHFLLSNYRQQGPVH